MKTFSLIIFTFFYSIITFSQEKNGNIPNLNQKDNQGRKQGEWRYYDKKAKIFVISSFKNDLLHGSTVFYKNDQVLFQLKYLNNQLNGINQAYQKGNLALQVELKDNQLHGVLQRYDVKKKELRCVQIYQNNLREGKAEYFLQKKLHATAHFKNDLLDGEYITYHLNGKMATKILYEKGILASNQQEFDMEGNLIAEKTLNEQKNGFNEKIIFENGQEMSRKSIKEEAVCVFGKTDVNKLFFKNYFYDILPH